MSMAGGAGALLIGLACAALTACSSSRQPPPVTPAAAPDHRPSPPEEDQSHGARPPGPTSRLTGRLDAHDGRPLLSAAIILTSTVGDEPVPLPADQVTLRPDGTFEFRNVPGGRYEIRARGETEPNGTSLFATFRVIVDGRDFHNVNLVMEPGAVLSGTVLVERVRAPGPPSFDGVQVRAPLTDGSSFGDAVTGQVGDSGAFVIRGLLAGTHAIRVDGLPDPWVLKSVVYRGRDITDNGIDTGHRQQFRDLRVTITDAATDVSGTVRDAGGNPAAGAVVVLAPLASQFWSRTSRRLAVVRADAGGRYRVRGLPAGEYRGRASMTVDEAGAFRREWLEQVLTAGEPLSLRERETRVFDLSLPRTAPGQESQS